MYAKYYYHYVPVCLLTNLLLVFCVDVGRLWLKILSLSNHLVYGPVLKTFNKSMGSVLIEEEGE